jgi:hypothetical protein
MQQPAGPLPGPVCLGPHKARPPRPAPGVGQTCSGRVPCFPWISNARDHRGVLLPPCPTQFNPPSLILPSYDSRHLPDPNHMSTMSLPQVSSSRGRHASLWAAVLVATVATSHTVAAAGLATGPAPATGPVLIPAPAAGRLRGLDANATSSGDGVAGAPHAGVCGPSPWVVFKLCVVTHGPPDTLTAGSESGCPLPSLPASTLRPCVTPCVVWRWCGVVCRRLRGRPCCRCCCGHHWHWGPSRLHP